MSSETPKLSSDEHTFLRSRLEGFLGTTAGSRKEYIKAQIPDFLRAFPTRMPASGEGTETLVVKMYQYVYGLTRTRVSAKDTDTTTSSNDSLPKLPVKRAGRQPAASRLFAQHMYRSKIPLPPKESQHSQMTAFGEIAAWQHVYQTIEDSEKEAWEIQVQDKTGQSKLSAKDLNDLELIMRYDLAQYHQSGSYALSERIVGLLALSFYDEDMNLQTKFALHAPPAIRLKYDELYPGVEEQIKQHLAELAQDIYAAKPAPIENCSLTFSNDGLPILPQFNDEMSVNTLRRLLQQWFQACVDLGGHVGDIDWSQIDQEKATYLSGPQLQSFESVNPTVMPSHDIVRLYILLQNTKSTELQWKHLVADEETAQPLEIKKVSSHSPIQHGESRNTTATRQGHDEKGKKPAGGVFTSKNYVYEEVDSAEKEVKIPGGRKTEAQRLQEDVHQMEIVEKKARKRKERKEQKK